MFDANMLGSYKSKLWNLSIRCWKFHADHKIVEQIWEKLANQLYLLCKEFITGQDIFSRDRHSIKKIICIFFHSWNTFYIFHFPFPGKWIIELFRWWLTLEKFHL